LFSHSSVISDRHTKVGDMVVSNHGDMQKRASPDFCFIIF
jgi:hypothetical protein